MGFWDVAGKVAKGLGRAAIYAGGKAYDAMENFGSDVKSHREEISRRDLSDSEVMRMYRTGRAAEKMAAAQELKDRGLM